ncbi:MAG TPA: helix-turn-helix domain-containing protein [Terriglobia bacterium]|nr:helix-turn-helix domain-containing protein [Terriglobia bacterium]
MVVEGVVLPDVLTLQEVAEFLRVSEEHLKPEVESGRLRVCVIGSERRILKRDLFHFLRVASGGIAKTDWQGLAVPTPAPRFTYKWPNGEERVYPRAFAGPVRVDDEWKAVQIGFGKITRAGKQRDQAVVFINHRPRVEFLGADNFELTNLMVSIIKTSGGRHVPVKEYIPFEYAGFGVEPYNHHVTGPNAFSGFAVVCKSDDLVTMTKVALIRQGFDSEAGTAE